MQSGARIIAATIRVCVPVVASLALIAGQPSAALARDTSVAAGTGVTAIVGVSPGSPEVPAQLPGSADRPLLTRLGGSGGTRPATRGGTKAVTKAPTQEPAGSHATGIAMAQAHASDQAMAHAADESAVMGGASAAAENATAATAATATATGATATGAGTITNTATLTAE